MINYPLIEQHTKSNRDFDSSVPRQKDAPKSEQSFQQLTTDTKKNGHGESKIQDKGPEERVIEDKSDDGESELTSEAGPPTEVQIAETLLQITQISFNGRQLTAVSFEDESQFPNNVEPALAVTKTETPLDTPLANVLITDDLRTLMADSRIETVDLKLSPKAELSPQSHPDLTRPADSKAAKLTTAVAEKDLVRDVRIDLSSTEMARVVTRRVSETLISEISLVENDRFKRITLKLHPAELGKLTLYVGWENETVKARIVASEFATSEMLNREKKHLMDTMQSHGLKFESFDVSYEGSSQKRSAWETHWKLPVASAHEPIRVEQAAKRRTLGTHGSVVNIIV